MSTYITNFDALATTPLRRDALSIVEAAYASIDTREVIKKSCTISGTMLTINNHAYDLSLYEHVYVIGFGKASCTAAGVLEEVLGTHVTSGLIIDKTIGVCRNLEAYEGAHPLPTAYNVQLSEKIVSLAEKATEKDLVIVIVSGGGSSLLCYPMSEFKQGEDLYRKFLHTGGSISELNTIRKHLSQVKGGGLAKMLYPATVVSLIFSDVPGDMYHQVASGPTYKDLTTIDDARAILKKYGIEDAFEWVETPKEDMYFEKVTNIPLVSNIHAVHGMEEKAKELGYGVVVLGTQEYREASVVIEDMKLNAAPKTVVLVAGETSVVVAHEGDAGGRNEYAAAKALSIVEEGQVCISFATDGIDNKSVAAGALIDTLSSADAHARKVDVDFYIKEERYDDLCEVLGTQLLTGPTGSNVSDCILYIQH